MVIVEVEKTRFGAWDDPTIRLYLDQFREECERLESISPNTAQLQDATDIASKLCEASREIVYRMHRVTRQQIDEAAKEFSKAAEKISVWTISEQKADLM